MVLLLKGKRHIILAPFGSAVDQGRQLLRGKSIHRFPQKIGGLTLGCQLNGESVQLFSEVAVLSNTKQVLAVAIVHQNKFWFGVEVRGSGINTISCTLVETL